MHMGPSRPPSISPVIKTPRHNVFALAENHSSPPPIPTPTYSRKKNVLHTWAPPPTPGTVSPCTPSPGGPARGRRRACFDARCAPPGLPHSGHPRRPPHLVPAGRPHPDNPPTTTAHHKKQDMSARQVICTPRSRSSSPWGCGPSRARSLSAEASARHRAAEHDKKKRLGGLPPPHPPPHTPSPSLTDRGWIRPPPHQHEGICDAQTSLTPATGRPVHPHPPSHAQAPPPSGCARRSP